MADEEFPHFLIPPELVRTDQVRSTGYSEVYPREDFGAHGASLIDRLRATRSSIARKRDSTATDTIFLKVTTPPTVPIRNEKHRFRQVGLELVTLSAKAPNEGTVRTSMDMLGELEGRILRYATEEAHPSRSYLSVIEDFGEVEASEKISTDLVLSSGTSVDCVIQTFSGLRERERAAIVIELRNFLVERGAEGVTAVGLSNGEGIVSGRVESDTVLSVADSFSTVRLISPDHIFFLTDSIPVAPVPNNVTVHSPASTVAVAVVDDGINAACPLFGGAIVTRLSQLPAGCVPDENHGTFVSSRILFGDNIESDLRSGSVTAACRVVDVPIFGTDSSGVPIAMNITQLAKAIETSVAAFPPETRVMNLSLGTDTAIRDNEFSVVARVLDQVARDHNLLIVTTAGNRRGAALISTFPSQVEQPHWRIDPPGESLLALTVGSIAKFGDASTLSRVNEVSPFSRRGPGADGGMKPDLVAHGGNCLLDGNHNSRFAVQGVHGSGTQIAVDVGTSHAAPLIARLAAQLFAHYQNPPANLVKALLCHFCNPVLTPPISISPELLVGFGEPDLNQCRWAGEHSAGFIFNGHLTKDKYKYLPFLIPEVLSPGGTGLLRIKATVVIDPPVNPDNPLEYASSRVALQLRKKVDVGFREVAISGASPADARWCPVVTFSEPFRRRYSPGNWELRLRLLTRNLTDDFAQGFSAFIEVIDDSGTVDVYRSIRDTGGAFRAIAVESAA